MNQQAIQMKIRWILDREERERATLPIDVHVRYFIPNLKPEDVLVYAKTHGLEYEKPSGWCPYHTTTIKGKGFTIELRSTEVKTETVEVAA